jgi:hypothetical protein
MATVQTILGAHLDLDARTSSALSTAHRSPEHGAPQAVRAED